MPAIVVVPFVREFGPGATGTDVRAVKRALIKASFGAGVDGTTEIYGAGAQQELEHFKAKHGLLQDALYTPQAHGYLAPFFDDTGLQLLKEEEQVLQGSHGRAAFLDTVAWTIQHHSIFDYTENEPYRSSMLRLRARQTAQRVGADCSMHFIGCGNWSGLTHRLFHADAYTGTILAELQAIQPGHAQPGDGVVFRGPRAPEGVHITILYEQLTGGDWRTANHGGQGQPGWSTLSGETSYHRSIAPELVYVQLPT